MDLAQLRAGIDEVDEKILALLNERARLVHSVASLKERKDIPFYVPSRERAVVARLQERNDGPFPTQAVGPVFQEIMSACLSLEVVVKIAFLGPEGTYTHMAVKRQFGLSARAIPVGTISGVFAEVSRGSVNHGVVPVENSSEGVVNHTLDTFVESNLRISSEILLEVSHSLLVRPGGSGSSVSRVYSHPQALAQCRRWLAENLPGAQVIEAASTAAAARLAREDAEGAAVASSLAARLHDLEVVREGIEDVPGNVTRFLVIGEARAEPTGNDKTSLMLGINDQPGILHRVLGPLAAHGINMTKIESRPSRRQAWEYLFFVDLEGHEEDPAVAAALRDLGKVCDTVKVLGSYPKADKL